MHTLQQPILPLRSVLYIEDNVNNLALVEQLIARRGDLVMLSATTGRRGIEMASEDLPVVILMDIQLPDISGLDALKCLRNNPATARIPVMALSSDAFPYQIKLGVEAGFCHYLTKPFKIDDFMDALDKCLDFVARNSYSSSSALLTDRPPMTYEIYSTLKGWAFVAYDSEQREATREEGFSDEAAALNAANQFVHVQRETNSTLPAADASGTKPPVGLVEPRQ